jgi:hypothetical protein
VARFSAPTGRRVGPLAVSTAVLARVADGGGPLTQPDDRRAATEVPRSSGHPPPAGRVSEPDRVYASLSRGPCPLAYQSNRERSWRCGHPAASHTSLIVFLNDGLCDPVQQDPPNTPSSHRRRVRPFTNGDRQQRSVVSSRCTSIDRRCPIVIVNRSQCPRTTGQPVPHRPGPRNPLGQQRPGHPVADPPQASRARNSRLARSTSRSTR